MIRNPLIVALDVPTAERALELARRLKGQVEVVKVGYSLFIQKGPAFVEALMREGFRVFLDLKFHDIPNTVANAVKAVMPMNPFMITLHTSGGMKMMEAAVKARNESQGGAEPTKLVGVTVLTSIDHVMLGRELRVMGTVEAHVSELAWMAKQSGLDGVVASSHELPVIRQRCSLNSASGSTEAARSASGAGFIIVVPGIRPAFTGSVDDQKRTMTPHDAIKRGADYLVVGRPIVEAADPTEAARQMSEEIQGALAIARGGKG